MDADEATPRRVARSGPPPPSSIAAATMGHGTKARWPRCSARSATECARPRSSGLRPTLAGVTLGAVHSHWDAAKPDRVTTQASVIIAAEVARSGEALKHGPFAPALRALDAIHDRIESPADRLLRNAGARSSYLVLPRFALANVGVALRLDAFSGRERLMAAIVAGLVVGKPLGILLASALAVSTRLALKPKQYIWAQLAGAGALGGIGFTTSLFIAGEAFRSEADFAAAKIAVLSPRSWLRLSA